MTSILEIENFNGQILQDEALSNYTTYKIGGPAKYFAIVNDIKSLQAIIKYCKDDNLDWFILGNGSNLLVSDDGFNGLVIKLDGDFKKIQYNLSENTLTVGSAVKLSNIVSQCKKDFLTNFEFAAGIPATLGGAIKMNAGAHGKNISSYVVNLQLLDKNGNVVVKDAKAIDWQYRNSSISDDEIVLDAKLKVKTIVDKQEQIDSNNQIDNFLSQRRKAQPVNMPSCGSVFKNPEGNFAGKLIEDAGLSNFRIGDACVSEKHCNFIVNLGSASAANIVDVINKVQDAVYKKFNVKLQPELHFVGFEKNCSLF